MGQLFEKPADYPIVIYQGGTFRLSFVLASSDDPSGAIDLTGCSAVAEFWPSPDAAAPIVRWNTDVSDTTITAGTNLALGGSDGAFLMEITDEATAQISGVNRQGFWYCILTYPDGDSTWLLCGAGDVATKKERPPWPL